MAEPETYLKASAALVSLSFAVIVYASGRRSSANWFLSLFFLLIAGNQAAETLRSMAADPGQETALFRLARVFASLDPFALYYFASIYPRRNRLNSPGRVTAVLGIASAFAASSWFMAPPELLRPVDVGLNAALLLFTAVVYTVVLASALQGLLANPRDRALRLLYPALCFAALPVWPRIVSGLGLPWLDAMRNPLGHSLAAVGPAIAVAGMLVVRAARGAPSGSDTLRLVARSTLAGLVISVILASPTFVPPTGGFFRNLGRGAASVRWLLFGFLVSMALLRHEMLGMSLRARRVAARALVALAFFVVAVVLAGLGQTVLGRGTADVPWFNLVFIAVALVASQGFRRLIDGVATAVYGVPMPGDVAATMEAYRLAAMQAAQQEATSPAANDLTRLREELGLGRRTADVIERMARAANWGRVAPGHVVAGRYRVQRLVGQGSAGRAFLAKDELLLREVVLKEILHDNLEEQARALREARLAGGLRHPNVVTLYDVQQRTDASLLVTEFAEGGSVADRVALGGRLPEPEAVEILDDVLAGLEAVHGRGVVHRDLKPANIFLTGEGRAKIGDFGVAWVVGSKTLHVGGANGFQGTPDFMAPEQKRGEPATPRTDLYAVGLLARHILPAQVSQRLRPVLDRALAEDSRMRWPSAAAMRAALRAASSKPATPGVSQPAPRPSLRNSHLSPEQEDAPADADKVPMRERPPLALG